VSHTVRWTLTAILTLIAAFCCFGFAASGEFKPPASDGFRAVYSAAVVMCVVAIVCVWAVKTRKS
jgi:hypothetical protein